MFADADAYESLMGRYSDLLAPRVRGGGRGLGGGRVLDVGCGPGALTVVLAGIVGAENVAGVDPSEPFVEATRKRVPGADVRVGPAEALPFEDDRFDRALAQLVFHFVADPRQSVSEMVRVTRPGGQVAACVWDMTGGHDPASLVLGRGARDRSGRSRRGRAVRRQARPARRALA